MPTEDKAAKANAEAQDTAQQGAEAQDEVRDTHTEFDAKHTDPVGPEEALERGYIGSRPGKYADSAYSLQTGPSAPSGENGPE